MRKLFPSGDIARYAGIFVGLASASLAVALNRAAIGQLAGIDLSILGDRLFIGTIIGVLALAGSTIVLWIVGQIFHNTIIFPAQAVVKKLNRIISRVDSFTLELCTEADLDEVSKLASESFGPLAASADRNRYLLSIDERSYWKLSNKAKRIVGFYCLFRLTAAGTRAIKRGEFEITTCPNEYLRKDQKYYYKDIYIAGIFGNGKRAQGMIWGALNQRAVELRPTSIFARAASEDGLRLLEQHGFLPVNSKKSGIGELYRR
jgi:hypothetical protein